MRWQSYWFEHNLGLQRRLPPVGHMSSDPVFIMGLWRSGTTYLHNLLSACPGLLAPRMWQCQSPASFRLRSPPARGPSAPRLMDLMKIDNLSPQEDEFALLALGVPTVYLFQTMLRFGREIFEPDHAQPLPGEDIGRHGQALGSVFQRLH
jgi:hypothetical protein